MGLRTLSWDAFWLDDAWTKPGKTHAFVRGVCGTGYRALCGYEPAWNANTMYGYVAECKRCRAVADKKEREDA